MGAYDFLVNGAQGVQLPDPVARAQQFMSLSQIVNANKLSQYALQSAQRKDAAATGVGQALGGLDINDDAAVTRAIQSADPDARQGILDAVLAARKTMALAGKDTAEAGKNKAETQKIQLGVAGGLAQTLLTKGPATTAQDVAAANANAARVGLPGDMFTPPPGADPASHWQSIAGAATTAAQQLEQQGQAATRAETAGHNRATESQAQATLGQTATRDANTAAYQRGELGIGQQNAASNAQRARAAMVTADPFNLNGLQGGGGGGLPSAPSGGNAPLPQGVNPADAQLFKAAVADAARNGQPTFKIGAQGPFNVADYQAPAAPTGGAPAPAQGGGTPLQQAMASGKHGDEFLAVLPPALAAQVKALADGREAFPTGAGLRAPQTQALLQLVSQYDPNFDAVNYNARSATRKDFTSGKSAQSINALNTVMGHLDELDKASAALNNTDYPKINSVFNWVAKNTGDPRIDTFNATAQAVVSELERAYRGSGGSQGDIEQWRSNLNAAASPEQFKAVIGQMVNLLHSKMDALGEQYGKGMGTTADGMTLLDPKAQATFDRLSGNAPQNKVAAAKGGNEKPVPIKGDDGYNALPSGTLFVGPDGVPRRKP